MYSLINNGLKSYLGPQSDVIFFHIPEFYVPVDTFTNLVKMASNDDILVGRCHPARTSFACVQYFSNSVF